MDDDEGARRASGGARACGARNDGTKKKKKKAPHTPHTPHPSAPRNMSGALPPSPSEGEGLRISPNKNRLVQVRRAGKRKLFDKARKEVFLEWMAATCNVLLSSEMAGICDKTVYKHLLKDEAFVEAFTRAVRVGYLRLEAREMQEAHHYVGKSGTFAEGPLHHPLDGPPPSAAIPPSDSARRSLEARSAHPAKPNGEEYQVRILPDEVVEEHFDPQLALQLLREHRRHLPGSAEKRPAQRTTARVATSDEVVKALTKRLKGFAIRIERESKNS